MKKNELEKTDKSERETRMRDAIKKAAFALMAEKGLDKVVHARNRRKGKRNQTRSLLLL